MQAEEAEPFLWGLGPLELADAHMGLDPAESNQSAAIVKDKRRRSDNQGKLASLALDMSPLAAPVASFALDNSGMILGVVLGKPQEPGIGDMTQAQGTQDMCLVEDNCFAGTRLVADRFPLADTCFK